MTVKVNGYGLAACLEHKTMAISITVEREIYSFALLVNCVLKRIVFLSAVRSPKPSRYRGRSRSTLCAAKHYGSAVLRAGSALLDDFALLGIIALSLFDYCFFNLGTIAIPDIRGIVAGSGVSRSIVARIGQILALIIVARRGVTRSIVTAALSRCRLLHKLLAVRKGTGRDKHETYYQRKYDRNYQFVSFHSFSPFLKILYYPQRNKGVIPR